MSFDALLTHTVHIERDAETGAFDDYNHPVTAPQVGEEFKADLQPRSAREQAVVSQAGASVGDWTIFMRPRLITSADKVVHDASACGVPEERDLPDCTFEVGDPHNPTGRGHHLEVEARLIESAAQAVAGS